MRMTWMRLGLLAVLVVAAIYLNSCNLTKPISITDRITDFVTSLNGDRSDTFSNLDPSVVVYTLGKPAIYWATFFPVGPTYSFAPNPPNTSSTSAVSVTINGTACVFNMVNTGSTSDNWVIHGLTVGGIPAVF
jgi:hypothetical protein